MIIRAVPPMRASPFSAFFSTSGLWLASTIAPIVIVALLIVFYGVDVPQNDEWNHLQRYYHLATGAGSWSDLTEAHNGNRLFASLLLYFGLIALTHWNARIIMFASLLLALATFLIIRRWARRDAFGLSAVQTRFWLLLAAWLMFSANQFENWLMGMQLAWFMALLASVQGIWLISQQRLDAASMLTAGLAGVVATFSVGAGLAFWPASTALLVLRALHERRPFLPVVTWIIAGIFVLILYFHGLRSGSETASLSFGAQHPLQLGFFAISMLGASAFSVAGSASPPRADMLGLAIGAFGIAAAALLVLHDLHRNRKDLRPMLFPAGLIALALGCVLMASVARVGGGPAAAYASRYITATTPFWVGLSFFALRAWSPDAGEFAIWRTFCARGVVLILCCGAVVDAFFYIPGLRDWREVLEVGRHELVRGQVKSYMAYLHPGLPQAVEEGRPLLKRLGLSVFREGQRLQPPVVPQPLHEFSQRIEAVEAMPRSMNRPAKLHFRITNTGSESWSRFGENGGNLAVNLASVWLNEDSSQVVIEGARAHLDADLAPGDAEVLALGVSPPDNPGHYILRISAVQEGVAWFYERGGRPLDVPITIGH